MLNWVKQSTQSKWHGQPLNWVYAFSLYALQPLCSKPTSLVGQRSQGWNYGKSKTPDFYGQELQRTKRERMKFRWLDSSLSSRSCYVCCCLWRRQETKSKTKWSSCKGQSFLSFLDKKTISQTRHYSWNAVNLRTAQETTEKNLVMWVDNQVGVLVVGTDELLLLAWRTGYRKHWKPPLGTEYTFSL